MLPVTVVASVRYMTASVMSLIVDGRPIGDRPSITSLGVFRCIGVYTAPGATAFTRMPSFAYSIARCWVIVSRPPLVIIDTDLGFPLGHPALGESELLFAGMEEFRQHLGGELTLTMLPCIANDQRLAA